MSGPGLSLPTGRTGLPIRSIGKGVTRAVEDKLSDALHERLAERFVDRRTSVLMRRLRENTMLETEIGKTGEVIVEGHVIGRLDGFMFAPDASAAGSEAKALNAAAQKALAGEIDARATRLSQAPERSDRAGHRRRGALDRRSGRQADRRRRRVASARAHHRRRASHRAGARSGADAARSLAQDPHREAARAAVLAGRRRRHHRHGARRRLPVGRGARRAGAPEGGRRGQGPRPGRARDVAQIRRALRRLSHLSAELLKPAPRALATQLWALKHESPDAKGVGELLHLAASGRTSIPVDKDTPKPLYRTAGYRVCGERAVRVDILERLADLIRPALSWREGAARPKPDGAFDGRGFTVTGAMTSLTGASGEDFASILRSLGYRMERKPKPVEAPAARRGSGRCRRTPHSGGCTCERDAGRAGSG